jgi:ribonuclease P protein component
MIVTAKPTNPAHPPAPKRMHSGARGTAPKLTSAPATGNSFPKSARLLKHASFQHVYENGRKHFSTTMIFFFVLKPVAGSAQRDSVAHSSPDRAPSLSPSFGDRVGTASVVQVGITVGRALGGAVDRNRIKRRMRDIVRHNLGTLREMLVARGVSAEVVINPKKAALTADIATLRAEVERGFGVIAAANVAARGAGDARTR